MFVLIGSVLLAIFIVPGPWGQLVVGAALVWEVGEKLFLLRYSKRMPPVLGGEALVGLSVTAVSACLPEGWVKLRGERWKARCNEGAGVGDALVVEAVDQITLIVSQPCGCAPRERLGATQVDRRGRVSVGAVPGVEKGSP